MLLFTKLLTSHVFLGLYISRYVCIWEIIQLIHVLSGNPGMKISLTLGKYKETLPYGPPVSFCLSKRIEGGDMSVVFQELEAKK